MNSTKNVVLIVVLVLVVVAVVKYLDRNGDVDIDRRPAVNTSTTRMGNDMERGLENAADNVSEGIKDAGRKLEDAVD